MEGVGQVEVERRGGLLGRFRPREAPDGGGIDGLLRAVKASSAKADLKEIQRAFAFAEESHRGQKRLSGEDFIEHPIGVATILADLGTLPDDRQKRTDSETLDIFVPLAHRLGVDRIKWELEDRSFATLYPKRYEEISTLVEQREGERQEYLDSVAELIKARLPEAKI